MAIEKNQKMSDCLYGVEIMEEFAYMPEALLNVVSDDTEEVVDVVSDDVFTNEMRLFGESDINVEEIAEKVMTDPEHKLEIELARLRGAQLRQQYENAITHTNHPRGIGVYSARTNNVQERAIGALMPEPESQNETMFRCFPWQTRNEIRRFSWEPVVLGNAMAIFCRRRRSIPS